MHDAHGIELASRLERGELVSFLPCPFDLPGEADREFLRTQSLADGRHKNISFAPETGKVAGCRRHSSEQVQRLASVLGQFSTRASAWLASVLPNYATAWRLDRATFRPEEEATRRLRLTARNDLLHIDTFPTRPTNGWRILRLFVNVHPAEPRVWATSDTFARILARFGAEVGLSPSPKESWARRIRQGLFRLLPSPAPLPTRYDQFMLRLHHFLKSNDLFQQCSSRRIWRFPPGSAWLIMSDGVSYAELRGQYALEHSYFIAPSTLALPEEAPAALLEKASGSPALPRAA